MSHARPRRDVDSSTGLARPPENAKGGTGPFERRAAELGYALDAAQRRAIEAFRRIEREIADAAPRGGLLRRWLPVRTPVAARGLYLWGGVGRGKSFLMDTWCDDVAVTPKRRVHFHRFMQEIHAALRELQGREEPMREVAARVAREARLLCLDEFQVTDIGDAMLMRKLLEGLMAEGVTIVTTSNTAPDDLYLHGLQRGQFLPAIALIRERFEVVHMDDGTDYRQMELERAGTWHCPPGPQADEAMRRMFEHITGGDPAPETVTLEGRTLECRGQRAGAAWFDFTALCDGPRAQADYIELARRHHSVFLSGVPVFARSGESDRMRRFTWLVDEFYDRRVKLIVSADADAIGLYSQVDVTAEQERTSSRLIEMQSHRYLGEPHQG